MTTKVHSQTEQPPRDKVRDSWLVKVIRQLCQWALCLERKPISLETELTKVIVIVALHHSSLITINALNDLRNKFNKIHYPTSDESVFQNTISHP